MIILYLLWEIFKIILMLALLSGAFFIIGIINEAVFELLFRR